ncbi:hypothetical protein [Acinetobacter larvae]|uniref:C-type lysozyme inhibitor domain-containing protein n=1 Tax=Acinetobacter larvae TaxID=1789224 RepID=A0A1B2M265_9GAMM|nr:hypothetical protein [Acinetobacter larvae]AOA59278.1 hypothetical protein BFG52_13555 [Acinetobacter larvae]
MKKLVLAVAMGAVLAGCDKNTENKNVEAELQQTASNAVEVASVVAETETAVASTVATIENEENKDLKFAAQDGSEYTLSTTDNFKTATLKDHSGKSYALKEVITASGMRLESDEGVNISLKGDEGTVEIEKDKVISVKEVK